LVEARVDADRLILATRSALSVDGALLQPQEHAAIDAAIAHLDQVAREASDAAAIEAATEALAKATEGFAAERMNHSIQKALAGRNVETL
jgi:molecular chaperone HscA